MQLSQAIPSLPAISWPVPTSTAISFTFMLIPTPTQATDWALLPPCPPCLGNQGAPRAALTLCSGGLCPHMELCAASGRGCCTEGIRARGPMAPCLWNVLSIIWEGLKEMPWAPHETRSPVTQQKMPLEHKLLQKPLAPYRLKPKLHFNTTETVPHFFPSLLHNLAFYDIFRR